MPLDALIKAWILQVAAHACREESRHEDTRTRRSTKASLCGFVTWCLSGKTDSTNHQDAMTPLLACEQLVNLSLDCITQ